MVHTMDDSPIHVEGFRASQLNFAWLAPSGTLTGVKGWYATLTKLWIAVNIADPLVQPCLMERNRLRVLHNL